MIINEYGDCTLPKVVLLHPMLADASCMFLSKKSMKGKYCFIIPDFSGHGKDTNVYQSAKQEADGVIDYLKAKNYSDIALLMGASMGGVIALRLLSDPWFHFQTIVLEGTPSAKEPRLITKVVQMIFLKKNHKAKTMKLEQVEQIMEKNYGKSFALSMAKSFMRMDEQSIKNIVYDCANPVFPTLSIETQKRIFWAVGDKDMNYRGLKNVCKLYPQMNVIVQKGYGHCGYIAEHCDEYGALLEKYMEQTNNK